MNSFAAAAPSRFSAVGRWPARIILLFLMILSIQGLSKAPIEAPAPASVSEVKEEEQADVLLYRQIIAQVRDGRDYYHTAAREHRARGYPLKPFVTVRLPTLAYVHAALPPFAPPVLLYLLVAATLGAWAWRLSLGGLPVQRAALGAMLLLAGAATLLIPYLIVWHECWAALLIALSLALRGERRYAGSVLAAFAAMLIREQALLYAAVMLLGAFKDRRAGEATAWATAILAAVAYIGWHAGQVAAVTTAADLGSPGWSGTGGWQAAVSMVQMTGPLRLMPPWVSAILVPIALVGWAGWTSPNGARGTAFLALYMILLAGAARLDNFYWAFLIAPLLPVGLLFAPRGLADLLRAASAPGSSQAEPASLST